MAAQAEVGQFVKKAAPVPVPETAIRKVKLPDGHTYTRKTVFWRTVHNTVAHGHSYYINETYLGWTVWDRLHREIDLAIEVEDAMRAAGHAPTLEEVANVA